MITPIIYTGSQFRDLRQQHKISIRELAKETGITSTTISRWERGLQTVTLTTAGKLLKAIKTKTP